MWEFANQVAIGLVTGAVTGVFSFVVGRLFERRSLQERYYTDARTDLKKLLVEIGRTINQVGAPKFKRTHERYIRRKISKYWSKHTSMLQYFLHTKFDDVAVARSRFDTSIDNLMEALISASRSQAGNLQPANNVYKGELKDTWRALFQASFPAAPLLEYELRVLNDGEKVKLGKGHDIPFFGLIERDQLTPKI